MTDMMVLVCLSTSGGPMSDSACTDALSPLSKMSGMMIMLT